MCEHAISLARRNIDAVTYLGNRWSRLPPQLARPSYPSRHLAAGHCSGKWKRTHERLAARKKKGERLSCCVGRERGTSHWETSHLFPIEISTTNRVSHAPRSFVFRNFKHLTCRPEQRSGETSRDQAVGERACSRPMQNGRGIIRGTRYTHFGLPGGSSPCTVPSLHVLCLYSMRQSHPAARCYKYRGKQSELLSDGYYSPDKFMHT